MSTTTAFGAEIKSLDDTLVLSGNFDRSSLSEDMIEHQRFAADIKSIDGLQINHLDSTGAYFLLRLSAQWNINCIKLSKAHENLYQLVQKFYSPCNPESHRFAPYEKVYQIGEQATQYIKETKNLIGFIGEAASCFYRLLLTPFTARWKLLLDIITQTGVKAIGIVSLLCFLIGVVLCYQVGSQLKIYGANIFVVDLLGISLLREFAPLITAIIVAGRTASAYAAEIGTMKLQEEIDALKTFGINPIQRLVVPRIIGIVIALPLLIVIADIISLIGGMIMAKVYLGIGFYAFVDRFEIAVSVNNYIIGLIKAPFFAIIIGTVGCYRGIVVKNDSLSLGQETTRSVVYAIFLIIITDALFSILFSAVGI
ncbi:MAG: MlaE family ABC transporter permease [Francisellaceae bacterium]